MAAPATASRAKWLPVAVTVSTITKGWTAKKIRTDSPAGGAESGEPDEQAPADVHARHRGVGVEANAREGAGVVCREADRVDDSEVGINRGGAAGKTTNTTVAIEIEMSSIVRSSR